MLIFSVLSLPGKQRTSLPGQVVLLLSPPTALLACLLLSSAEDTLSASMYAMRRLKGSLCVAPDGQAWPHPARIDGSPDLGQRSSGAGPLCPSRPVLACCFFAGRSASLEKPGSSLRVQFSVRGPLRASLFSASCTSQRALLFSYLPTALRTLHRTVFSLSDAANARSTARLPPPFFSRTSLRLASTSPLPAPVPRITPVYNDEAVRMAVSATGRCAIQSTSFDISQACVPFLPSLQSPG